MWILEDKKGMGATLRKKGDPEETREMEEGNGGKYKQITLHVCIKCHNPTISTVSIC